MPYRLATQDREHDKFVQCPTGETAVRVCVSNESSDPIPVDIGAVSGLSVGVSAPTGPLRRSVVNVTDVAADPIAIPLANRVALTIRNKDPVHTVYLGEDNTITQDDLATGGWEIGPGEDFSIDLSEDNVFFLIAPAGQSVIVKILEIASSAAGGGGGGLPGVMTQEIPAGLINNANNTFTITTNPLGAGYFTLYLDGILLRVGTHYTRIGQTITMVTAPNFGQTLDAVYWY